MIDWVYVDRFILYRNMLGMVRPLTVLPTKQWHMMLGKVHRNSSVCMLRVDKKNLVIPLSWSNMKLLSEKFHLQLSKLFCKALHYFTNIQSDLVFRKVFMSFFQGDVDRYAVRVHPRSMAVQNPLILINETMIGIAYSSESNNQASVFSGHKN